VKEIDSASRERLARECAGSEELLKALLEQAGEGPLTAADHVRVCKLVANACDFGALMDTLDARPEDRRTYRFTDDTTGDVYRALLKAIAADPIALAFGYEDLVVRVKALCQRGQSPAESSLRVAIPHLALMAPVLAWDETSEILDVRDPSFLFYLRWSDRLLHSQ
jgi:hypothetical protein